MCLIGFSWKQKNHKLIVLANRDEFYNRPTRKATWHDNDMILAGTDLQAGGTWMGVNKSGKFAAITNFRDLKNIKKDAPSRGDLTINFLKNNLSPAAYLEQIKADAQNYNGFNLLLSDNDDFYYYSNIENKIRNIEPGIYGLSNHLLNTPWPKVEKAKDVIGSIEQQIEPDIILADFKDTTCANDHLLPDTGVGIELERKLSPMFIHFDNYGTRCTTLLTIDYQNRVTFRERTFNEGNKIGEDAYFAFDVNK